MTVYWPGGSPDTKLIIDCDGMSTVYYNYSTRLIRSRYILLTSACINILVCIIAFIGSTDILCAIQSVIEVHNKMLISSLKLPPPSI